MTPRLFHGPSARDKAVSLSLEIGRPVGDPVGDKGLKVDDSREIVELASHSGIGDKAPTIVVGPIDQASPEASDALLKTLEDLAEGPLRIILWADFLNEVSPTIQSRTIQIWCPPDKLWIDPLSQYSEQANKLFEALLKKDQSRVLDLVGGARDNWADLLQALCGSLAQHVLSEPKRVLETWNRFRLVLDGRGSFLVAVDALLERDI